MSYVPKSGDRVRVVNRNDPWNGGLATFYGEISMIGDTAFYEVIMDEGRSGLGVVVPGGKTNAGFMANQLEAVTEPKHTEAELQREITAVLFEKYQKRAPQDAWWLARDDAMVIMRNLDDILPILRRIK